MNIKQKTGFTLIELMVVISIIGILSAVLYANFSDARAQSRDKVRMSALKEVQLALEFYKAQNGVYPAQGCGTPGSNWAGKGPHSATWGAPCDMYITGLVPDFISSLPTDPTSEYVDNKGYLYMTNTSRTAYKLLAHNVVEKLLITSLSDEFARCPSAAGSCTTSIFPTTYAVYSAGAETW